MTTHTLHDFASNYSTRSWPLPNGQRRRMRTVTMHEHSCRYAVLFPNGKYAEVHLWAMPYGGNVLDLLRQRGVDGPNALFDEIAWRGCRVCGTALIRRKEWAAMVQAYYDEAAEAQRLSDEAYAATRALETARAERDVFVRDAEAAVYEAEFRAAVDARMARVRTRALEVWAESHPEQAALIEADRA